MCGVRSSVVAKHQPIGRRGTRRRRLESQRAYGSASLEVRDV
jgi:hypothetical protein